MTSWRRGERDGTGARVLRGGLAAVVLMAGCAGGDTAADPTSAARSTETPPATSPAPSGNGSDPVSPDQGSSVVPSTTAADTTDIDTTCQLAEPIAWLDVDLTGAVTEVVEGTPSDMVCGFGSFSLPDLDVMVVGTLDTLGEGPGQVRLNAGPTSYGTDVDACTVEVTDLTDHVAPGSSGTEGAMQFVEATATCEQPLVEVGGPGEVVVEHLQFGTYLLP